MKLYDKFDIIKKNCFTTFDTAKVFNKNFSICLSLYSYENDSYITIGTGNMTELFRALEPYRQYILDRIDFNVITREDNRITIFIDINCV